ncbi:hypothetical protein SprV_0802493100 [Sparganum proliferum]
MLVTKAIAGTYGWTDHRLVISKMRIRLQPRRRPQGKRPPATTARDAGCLDCTESWGDQGYADRNEWKNFSAIKAVYGPPTKSTAPLLSADGDTLLIEKTQILQRWAEHFRDVLNRPSTISDAAIDRLPQVETNMDLDLPPSLQETIRAVQQLSSGKAPRSDVIPAEVYKHGGSQLMDHLTALFQEMRRQGEVPQDFKDATIVHLYKRKGNRQVCDNHRGISLLNIAGKIFTRILLNRLHHHLEQGLLPESQCGFRRHRGTTDMVFAARQLHEKCQEMRTHLYSTFVDLMKAFETVNREGLWKIMQKFGCLERFTEMNDVSVLPLIRDISDRAKRLSEEKQLAEEVQPSTTLPFLISILCLIFRTLLEPFSAKRFSRRLIWCVLFIRFQSPPRTSLKPPSRHPSVSSSSSACRSVFAMPPKPSRAYIDDLLVASRSEEEHKKHLALVFDRLDKIGVVVNPSKCVLGVPSLEFLGHQFDSEGLRPLPSKVEAVRNFPPPTSKRQLQRFLGMVNFYRRFLPNCADLMLPLTNMLSGPKGPLELTGDALTAFERIKNSLADATFLTHPAPEAQLSLMFTSDIGHIDGSRNEVADALSRPSIVHLRLSSGIDLTAMAAEQRRVSSPCDEDVSGLQLQDLPLTTGNGTILCDVSTTFHRPFVPPPLRRKVFSSLHNLSHPGSRAADKLVSDRFV